MKKKAYCFVFYEKQPRKEGRTKFKRPKLPWIKSMGEGQILIKIGGVFEHTEEDGN